MMDPRIYSVVYVKMLSDPMKFLLSVSYSKEKETIRDKEKDI